jgi:hypothetical protein
MRASLHETIAATLRELPVPVFFAGVNTSMSRLTVHVHAGCDTAALKAQVASAVQKAGEPLEVTVCAHRLSQLAFPRSLERWLSRFGDGYAMHDPTMIVSRAKRLLAVVKSCRAALGNAITGSFYDAEGRTLLLLARKGIDGRALSALQLQAAGIAREAASLADNSSLAPPTVNVQVVTSLPRRRLVPVERGSAWLLRRAASALRRWLAPAAVVLAMSSVPAAASLQTGPHAAPGASTSTRASVDFGILPGLTPFADTGRYDPFAAVTLEWFFGGAGQAAVGSSIVVAEGKSEVCKDTKGKNTGADCVPFYTGS